MNRRSVFVGMLLGLILGALLAALVLFERGDEPAPAEERPAAVEPGPPDEAVLAVVQELFDAIAERDTAAVRRVMYPEGRLVAVSSEGDSIAVRISTRDAFMASLAGSEAHFLERMWDARVRIDGPMATVWAPYDFHVDEEFSHCGVDVFDLVRSRQGWRIVSVTYTRRPPGQCGEGPA